MNTLQTRMYNYEVPPPKDLAEKLFAKIGDNKVYKLNNGKIIAGNFAFRTIAAVFLMFLLVSIFFQMRPDTTHSINNNFEGYRLINENNNSLVNNLSKNILSKKSYITLEGPQGKVKVSSKVAAIFVIPEASTKMEWNKKLAKWKNIMMTASNTDFMDVIPLTQISETEN